MAGFAQLSLEMMVMRAGAAREKNAVKKMNVIYEPGGRAREYAALAVNLYSGCGHACSYCYAPAALQMNRQKFCEQPGPRARDFWNKLESDLKSLEGKKVEPVLMCFSCDAYQPIDVELELARKALGMFKKHDVAFQVLSKGGMRCARDFDLYKPGRDIFAVTMTFMDAEKSKQWEPGAALPADRIEALKLAHSMGIKTWVSLEPVIEPAESFACIDACADYVDGFKVGTWNHDKRAKEIDWYNFGHAAVAKIGGYGKELYVKKDLKEKM
ncbi:MAG: hypothetical protein A4E49_00311 [Methanosaeta sp. PtaU1.Bin112]|nr:MAG: hypothetical protein A4E49_00311 [Methanosaeta sp. PtaU1.Bin112]